MVSQLQFNHQFALALSKTKFTPLDISKKLQNISSEVGMTFNTDKFEPYMDPFSVMAFYNSDQKGLKENKERIAELLIREFQIDIEGVPTDYSNIPIVKRRYHFVDRGIPNREEIVDKTWMCFQTFVNYAQGLVKEKEFIEAFDYFASVKGNINNPHNQLTIGLFWIDSEKYCSFDSRMQDYVLEKKIVPDFKKVDGKKYLEICSKIFDYIRSNNLTPDELSGLAYKVREKRDDKGDDLITREKDMYGLNTILYGPPGTGKTYEARKRAISIITGKIPDDNFIDQEFKKLVEEHRITFVTFHQSFGYEEFIEGYKPSIRSDDPENPDVGEMVYKCEDGVFKKFCMQAVPNRNAIKTIISDEAQIWKMILGDSKRKDIHDDCIQNNYLRLGYDEEIGQLGITKPYYDKRLPSSVNAFFSYMSEGDIVLIRSSSNEIDAVAKITGPCIIRNDFSDYRQTRPVEWLYHGESIRIDKIPNSKNLMEKSIDRISWMTGLDVSRLIDSGTESGNDKYVFIIDEINRGNVSRIFGETITLIEDDKRSKVGSDNYRFSVKLSYSKEDFWIPDNIFIIGTMNTADRSLVSLDTALRRRFNFERVMPNSDVAKNHSSMQSVDIKQLMDTINNRIAALYDQEHLIGHSYFMGIDDFEQLKKVFNRKIIPLLEEYFHNDFNKIINILSVKGNPESSNFIQKIDKNDPFDGNLPFVNDRYELTPIEIMTVEMFKSIYE